MAKLTEDEIKQQREYNKNLAGSEALKCLAEHYDNDLEVMLEELADTLESDERKKLKNSLDPEYQVVEIYDHDYDLDVILDSVDSLEDDLIGDIKAILEDMETGGGYAKNWLDSLKLSSETKLRKIKKSLNNMRLGA